MVIEPYVAINVMTRNMLKNNVSHSVIHNDGIDMLRGFSILSVILLHCFIHMPFAQGIFPERLTNIIFRSGYYGVIVFFVISGFLITTTSIKKWGGLNDIRPGQFYRMRFARIIPCLLTLLLILSALDIFGVNGFVIHTASLGQAIFSALTFHINWLEAKTGYLPGNWDVLWSLSVEEVFYLFFPLVCLTLKKRSHFIVAMLIFIILGPFSRTVFTGNEIWSDHSYLSCMDGIAVGCLAALFANSVNLNRKIFLRLLFTGLSLFVFVFIFRKQAYDSGLTKTGLNVTVLEIGIAMILIAMQEWYGKGKHVGMWLMAPFRWLGCNSYEIYLTHSFIIIMLANILFNATQSTSVIIFWYTIAILLSGILGQLISTYFSEPLNRLIRTKNYMTDKTNASYIVEGR